MPEFPRVTSGQPLSIPAAAYNAMVDVIAKGGGVEPALPPSPLSGTSARAELLIKNNAGVDVPRFGILGISGVLIDRSTNADEFYNEPVLTGVKPDTDDHADRFVVAQEPIPAGGIRTAVITGTTVVQLDIQSDDDTLAGINDQDCTKLKSGSGSARILYVESGTGTKWAVVLLGGSTASGGRLLRADGDIAHGSSGTCHPVTLSGATPTEDTNTDVTVVNFLLPKIWDNSYLVAQELGSELVAVKAYSATLLRGKMTADVSGGNFMIGFIERLNGHFEDDLESIVNPLGFEGDQNGWAYAAWNDDEGQWECIQMECPE